MATPSFSEDDNIGSLRAINFALARELSSLNPVTFIGSAAWMPIDFLPESSSLKDSSKEVPNGTEYSYALTFAFNKQNTDLYEAFNAYIGTFGIAEVTDSNGLTRRLGTLANPVTAKHDADTGTAYTNLNFYKITVAWVNDKPAAVV